MKAILEFNLPEDEYSYKIAINAGSFYTALQEFDKWLRNNEKSGIVPTFEEVQQYFKETIQDINLYE